MEGTKEELHHAFTIWKAPKKIHIFSKILPFKANTYIRKPGKILWNAQKEIDLFRKESPFKASTFIRKRVKILWKAPMEIDLLSKISPFTLSSKQTHITENKTRIYCTPNSKCTDPALL